MDPSPIIKSDQSWFIKYKLYHIPFWCVYHYLWWLGRLGDPFEVFSIIFNTQYSIKFIFAVIFQASAVYFNLYFLIPKYLEKNRILEYLLFLATTIICATSFIVSGYYLIAFYSGETVLELFGSNNFVHLFINNGLPSTMASMTLAMSIKLTKNWIETKRRQQLLEKEKLETELKFLKYQFNPHFLFNTINSIFFLIHRNPHMASDSLAKFSELLRYQLYECNDKQIPLGSEIDYLENFIELEKLRQNDHIKVRVEFPKSTTSGLGIAPFILMTFVENAFKHVSKDSDTSNWIHIRIGLDQQRLDFAIANSTSVSTNTDAVNYGGIGLKNVQRRLDLLYPGTHNFTIKHTSNIFEVKLRLELSQLQITRNGKDVSNKPLEFKIEKVSTT